MITSGSLPGSRMARTRSVPPASSRVCGVAALSAATSSSMPAGVTTSVTGTSLPSFGVVRSGGPVAGAPVDEAGAPGGTAGDPGEGNASGAGAVPSVSSAAAASTTSFTIARVSGSVLTSAASSSASPGSTIAGVASRPLAAFTAATIAA